MKSKGIDTFSSFLQENVLHLQGSSSLLLKTIQKSTKREKTMWQKGANAAINLFAELFASYWPFSIKKSIV